MTKLDKAFGWAAVTAAVALMGVIISGVVQSKADTDLQTVLAASAQVGNYCSSTVIQDPDLSDGDQLTLLTAKHCLDANQVEGSVLEVRFVHSIMNKYGQTDPVKVVIKDISKKSDLVLLQGMNIKDPRPTPVDIYGGIPSIGQTTYAVGYPRGESLTVSGGLLGYQIKQPDAFKELSTSGEWQKAIVSTSPGSSGGGLYVMTDTGLQLIGTLTWGYKNDPTTSYWTPVSEIREFLEETV